MPPRSGSTRGGWPASTATSPATSTTAGCPAGSSLVGPPRARSRTWPRYGHRDREAGLPVELDTLWRIYSMTKPVTSVAAMMLYEEGAFELNDPVARYLPAFADARVYSGGAGPEPVTAPGHRADPDLAPADPHRRAHLRLPPRPPRRRHLPGRRLRVGQPAGPGPGRGLRRLGAAAAAVPARHRVELLRRHRRARAGWSRSSPARRSTASSPSASSARSGMTDTGFFGADAPSRTGSPPSTAPTRDRRGHAARRVGAAVLPPRPVLSGGGGLVSTAARLPPLHPACCAAAASSTVPGCSAPARCAYMASNHLPGGADLAAFGRPAVRRDRLRRGRLRAGVRRRPRPGQGQGRLLSLGEYNWGGAASTAFWVDPVEDLTVQFLTQLLPSSTHPIRPQLKQLVYQALVD